MVVASMRKSVSVAMAVYNGQTYLKEQLDSILPQLYENDEIIVSLDPSNDTSREILEGYQDSRIHIFDGPACGVVANFENAIQHTNKDIIFLCDQDDVWMPDKVESVVAAFKEDTMVVLHDAKMVDENLNVTDESYFQFRNCQLGILHNIKKNSYIGCCMAFKKELKEYILPFPKPLPMHDQWIGLVGEIKGNNVLLDKKLLLYRRHSQNVSNTKHSSFKQMIVWRYWIIKAVAGVR